MHRGKKLCLLIAGGMLAASGVAASPAGAADTDARPAGQRAQGDDYGEGYRMLGQAGGQAVQLSNKEVEKLRAASERSGGRLSKDEVFRIAGVPEPREPAAAPRTTADAAGTTGTASMAEEGEAMSDRECSVVTLWGNSDGRWEWENWYKPAAGTALFGYLEVDTDGFGSIGSPIYEFSDDGKRYIPVEGSTIFVGPGADYTHAFAWSVNTSGWLCYSSLTAYWG